MAHATPMDCPFEPRREGFHTPFVVVDYYAILEFEYVGINLHVNSMAARR